MSKPRYSKLAIPTNTHPNTRPGKVSFDERGNAVYEWQDDLLNLSGADGTRLRERALRNPALAVVNEMPGESVNATNAQGLRIGYNPYDSGELVRTNKPQKRVDLRELSKWIKLKRRLDDPK